MSISMVGIDFNKASLDIRSKFSFTKKAVSESVERLKEKDGIGGGVILSTCNRMEVWASIEDEDSDTSLYDFLCEEKGVDPDEYRDCFIERSGREAVEHLFYLTSGLKSQILAEDQILTQVKDALIMSRDVYSTDSVIEVLFRNAVTAAKKVKTEIVFSKANTSVIHEAIHVLHEKGISLAGKKCMVIGNGEMGKLTALAMKEEGADVTVTVRQYRSGVVQIPAGCQRINYGDRLELLPECDVVVSATSSPNYTLTKEAFESAGITKDIIVIDLAVPRDIEKSIEESDNVDFYDVDSFRISSTTPELQKNIEKAGEILNEKMEEFYSWYSGKDLFPIIQDIRNDAVTDFNLRITKALKKIPMEDKDRESVMKTVDTAMGKVIIKMMFGLRDSLDNDTFSECVAGLQELYDEE